MPASVERVIVTGAASGIGAAVVELLSAQGAHVCGWDLRDRARGVAGPFFRVDVTNEAQVAEALWATERELGPIDALVNVAGVLSQLELCSAEATLAEL